MKKTASLALACLALCLALAGCGRQGAAEDPADALASLEKAQEVAVVDPATGETVATLTEKGELEDFVERLNQAMDSWSPAEGGAPEGDPDVTFIFSQESTLHLGEDAANREMEEICRFNLYAGEDLLTLTLLGVPLSFTVPETVTEALLGYLA